MLGVYFNSSLAFPLILVLVWHCFPRLSPFFILLKIQHTPFIFPNSGFLSVIINYNNPILDDSLHHPLPANIKKTLHAAAAEKIREYRTDYNNRPSHSISFIPAVPTTSDRLHCELVRIWFLQTHRETPLFCSFRSWSSATQPGLVSFPSHSFLLPDQICTQVHETCAHSSNCTAVFRAGRSFVGCIRCTCL